MLKCKANPDLLSGIKNTLLRTSIFTLFLVFFASPSFAQVGINTDSSNPDASAILDIKSTTKGMLVPRMATAQRDAISSPATGLLVFDTDLSSFWFYNGTAWEDLSAVETSDHIADADNDTKIQVEESANEDIIRFDIAGTEFGYMDGTTFHLKAPGNSLFIGNNAGLNDDGSDNRNTFIGIDAGKANTTGKDNTANGYKALVNTTTGDRNTANGHQALYSNTTGYFNTANGYQALYSNTIGEENIANGYQALYSNTTGYFNTANGYQALYSNTTGKFNTANGYQALFFNTNGRNTANGYRALYSNTTGTYNTANGYEVLFNTTTGNKNTGNGFQALFFNTTGSHNTANGYQVLYSNTTGGLNIANGFAALESNTTGNNNTAMGDYTLNNNTTGNDNTAVGSNANVGSGNLSNATAIGADALVSQSNSLVLGNGVNVGIGTSSPAQKLDVDGNASIDGNTFNVDDVNDRVGIGTSSPAQTLDVNGNASIDGNTFNVDDVNDRVGIGTSSPSQKLDVDGDIRIRGGSPNVGDVLTATSTDGTATWEDNKSRVATAKNADLSSYDGSDVWRNILSAFSLSVNSGDLLVFNGLAAAKLDEGSSTDNFSYRVSISGCASTTTNVMVLEPDGESGNLNHTKFKPTPYLDYWTASCNGTVNFTFQMNNDGDDAWTVKDRVLVVTKY